MGIVAKDIGDGQIMYWCDGCQQHHMVTTKHKNKNGAQWGFNGSFDKPTFKPSVNIHIQYGEVGKPDTRCHHFVREGNIQYLNDCTHDMKGQTVPLMDLEKI